MRGHTTTESAAQLQKAILTRYERSAIKEVRSLLKVLQLKKKNPSKLRQPVRRAIGVLNKLRMVTAACSNRRQH